MKYYLIAGEASGDLHGSNLMKEILKQDPQAEFRFWGGDLMQEQGGTLVRHYRELAFIGFVEVLANLRTVLRNLRQCKKDVEAYRPDVLVLIDFPGFNLKIAEFAKAKGMKVCFYISPKIWAWNQKRVHRIKKAVDRMLCILPFELDFYKRFDFDADYVGNPLMDAIDSYPYNPEFLVRHGLEGKKYIALLPGSRRMELEKIFPEMLRVRKHFPGYAFVIAGAPGLDPSYYERFGLTKEDRIVFGQTYDILKHAHAALVTSGTATLETALFRVPQVVCYKANSLSVGIARMLVKIRFISLVNLIADREVVRELIQEDCSEARISTELQKILGDSDERTQMLKDYEELAQKIGPAGASARAAAVILQEARK